jgi:ubiquinone/menaquinone biosynthesis C-methylase UbiE
MDQELRRLWGLGYGSFVQELVERIAADAGDLILDVATGTAQIPIAMAARPINTGSMIGLDITPAMLRRGQEQIKASGITPRLQLVCASAADMPFRKGLFDTVICGLGMHHMDVCSVLHDIRRVLKDGGRLVLACVDAPPLWRTSLGSAAVRATTALYSLTQRSVRAQAEVEAIPNLRTRAEWRSALLQVGFQEVCIAAEFQGRRLWYPGALILEAIKGAASY